jgi:hypothetical protein
VAGALEGGDGALDQLAGEGVAAGRGLEQIESGPNLAVDVLLEERPLEAEVGSEALSRRSEAPRPGPRRRKVIRSLI